LTGYDKIQGVVSLKGLSKNRKEGGDIKGKSEQIRAIGILKSVKEAK